MITTRLDESIDLTIQTVSGKVRAVEIEEAIRAFYDGSPTRCVLWDFQEADLSDLSTRDIQGLARVAGERAELRKEGKTALVFSVDYGFGLGRMFGAYTDSPDAVVMFQAFRSMESALAWLGVADG